MRFLLQFKGYSPPHKVFFSTGTDILLLYLDFGLSDKYVKDLSVDVKRGMASKASRRWWPSGYKTGYVGTVKDGEVIIKPDEERFPLLRLTIERFLTGNYTVSQVLDYLNNDLGYRSRKTRKLGGQPMTQSKLYKLFADPFSYGKICWGGEESWLHDSCPRLMSEDEFHKIQKLLCRRNLPRPSKHFELPYRGIFRCSNCGNAVIPYVTNKKLKNGKSAQYIFLKCTRNNHHIKCNESQIPVHEFEKQVLTILKSISISESFHDWAIKWLQTEHSDQKTDQKTILDSHTKNLLELQEKINRLIDMYSSNMISKEEFKDLKTKYENERQQTDNQIKALNNVTDNWINLAVKTIDFARDAKNVFETANMETRMEIVRALGSEFLLHDKKLYISLLKPYLVFKEHADLVNLDIARVGPEESFVCAKNEASENVIPKWWEGWESNPHSRFFRPVH